MHSKHVVDPCKKKYKATEIFITKLQLYRNNAQALQCYLFYWNKKLINVFFFIFVSLFEQHKIHKQISNSSGDGGNIVRVIFFISSIQKTHQHFYRSNLNQAILWRLINFDMSDRGDVSKFLTLAGKGTLSDNFWIIVLQYADASKPNVYTKQTSSYLY